MHRNSHGMMNDSLQDLDRELALLRRKRELIEEQQQLLNRPIGHSISPWAQPNERDFNNVGPQQRFIETDVLGMYDGGRGYNPRPDNRSESRKRHAETQSWDPPKRFRPPRSRETNFNRPKFNERSAPKSHASNSNQRPRSGVPPKPVGRESRAAAGPRPARGAVPKPELDVLGAEPTAQQQGRLELALGDIYAKVRADHKDRLEETFFTTHQNGKLMKQEIRSRIKNVLIGKQIGTRENIASAYWKAFPDSHDIVRISPLYVLTEEDKRKDKQAKDKAEKHVRAYTQEASIDHLRKDGVTMLERQLAAMFEKLEKIYEVDANDENSVTEVIKEIIKAEENLDDGVQTTDVAKTDGENNDAVKTEGGSTDTVKIEGENTDSANIEGQNADAVVKTDVANGDSAKTEGENTEESAENTEKDIELRNRIRRIQSIYEKLFTIMFRRKVTTLLPKYKGAFMKIIKSDISVKEGEEAEIRENEIVAPKPRVPLKDIPFFVVIFGRPKLPKRAKLSKFLWQFAPLSIKKHKTNFNVLFLGLGTKKDYDDILAKNGAQLAGCQLVIKPSEKFKKENGENASATENESFADDVTIAEDTAGDRDGDISLSSEIEGKIDDLLNSVNEDDKQTEETTDNQNAVGDENVQEAVDEQNGELETGDDQTNDQEMNETGVEANGQGVETVGDDNEVNNAEGKVGTASPVRATRRTSRLTQNK